MKNAPSSRPAATIYSFHIKFGLIMDLRTNFSSDIAKRILRNRATAEAFLLRMQQLKGFDLPIVKTQRGANAGEIRLRMETQEFWAKIVETWDYDSGLKVIRELFRETDKYQSGQSSFETMEVLVAEWKNLQLGSLKWPFSQGDFDGFVQRINSQKEDGVIKDQKVKLAAVQYRRLKEINTVRNDFIETLIFERNENILPTLSHRRLVDFFIDGVSYDQKVAKSPTAEFQRDFGTDWRQAAIDDPEKVAEYLYRFQDEGRFGADSRLLVVYLDEDVSIERISQIIGETNFEKPLEITFSYKHKIEGSKSYKVSCFVVLLHN